MAERVVSIQLKANASGLVQGVAAAKDAVGELKDEVKSSAMSQRQAWSTVGTGLTAMGATITGFGILALKTGIQYNTLQQTTRAALTSLLGSAEAASAQMDKLDDFARNSPFAKQVFIEAQQQMLAFGIEAKNVIPYLDSIQNAVAAAGGSNEDIAAISEIFGKISSSSKITATDLMQFGRRGINAAELIGSAMGKTGAEIREEITAGTLDADAALEALSEGMSTKFAGAADNVKETFAGAMDRVKAAWRDFAAELAKPLVDPEGGGALVDLLNWTADAMRNFEELPDSIKTTMSAIVGLTGVVALGTGAAMLAIPKWIEFKVALETLGFSGSSALGAMEALLPVAIALASVKVGASVNDWFDSMRSNYRSAEDFTAALEDTGSAADELQHSLAASGGTVKFTDHSQLAIDHLRGLDTGIGSVMATVQSSDFGKVLSVMFMGLNRDMGVAKEQVEEFDSALAGLVSSGNTEAAAAGFEEFAAMAEEAGWSQEKITEMLPEYVDAQAAAQEATDNASVSLEEIQNSAEATADAISTLADSILNFGKAEIDAERAAIAFEEQLAKLDAQVAASTGGLDISTEAGRNNRGSLLDMADATNKSAAATLEATGSQDQASSALARGRDALIRAAEGYGMTKAEASAYADQLLATPETVETAVKLIGVDHAMAMLADVTAPRQTIVDIVTRGGKDGPGSAYGGTVGYAHGGTIPGAAYGKTVAGYGGVVAGGTVYGQGGIKSDSINVNLSRGEEVTQEPYASKYRKELKAMNRGDFRSGMNQPPMIITQQAGQAGPLVESLTFVSSGNLHNDVGTVNHELRKLSKGGKYVGSR